MIDWGKFHALRHRQPLDDAVWRVLPLKNNIIALAENSLNPELSDRPRELTEVATEHQWQPLFGQLVGWAEGYFFFIIIQNNLI
jgi:hypothetical protein